MRVVSALLLLRTEAAANFRVCFHILFGIVMLINSYGVQCIPSTLSAENRSTNAEDQIGPLIHINMKVRDTDSRIYKTTVFLPLPQISSTSGISE